MSHSSTDSSLLHRNRPTSLPPQAPPEDPSMTEIHQRRVHLETHESRHLPETSPSRAHAARFRLTSHASLQTTLSADTADTHTPSCPDDQQQPLASTSSGMLYLNQSPTASMSYDPALPDPASPSTYPAPDRLQECCAKLEAARDGVVGPSMPRDQWQPDGSSALCSEAFCTTIFAPSASYFTLGPRRHHCRKCGLLFCSAHTSKRALFYSGQSKDGSKHLTRQRICDGCSNSQADSLPSEPLSRRTSQGSEASTQISDSLVTPHDSYFTLSRSSTRVYTPAAIDDDSTPLAPVQGWMDKDGVLSLYPLALPSDSRKSAIPAAGPLFAPSPAAKRSAKEREERIVSTLRQRRLGKEAEGLPGWVKSLSSSPTSVDEDDEEADAVIGGRRSAAPSIYSARLA